MPLPSDPPPLPLPDSGPERPTLKTIAAATGLAVATVSRALKDAPDIGEDTKRRVRETAARLGYRPNRAGVRLRNGKTNVIALVLSTETDVMNHTSRLIYSIASALRGTAYHLVVMPFFPDQDPMEPIRYLVGTESADGVILNQTKEDDPRIRYMTERHFPFAAHGRTSMGLDHPYLGERSLAVTVTVGPPPDDSSTGDSDSASTTDATTASDTGSDTGSSTGASSSTGGVL